MPIPLFAISPASAGVNSMPNFLLSFIISSVLVLRLTNIFNKSSLPKNLLTTFLVGPMPKGIAEKALEMPKSFIAAAISSGGAL